MRSGLRLRSGGTHGWHPAESVQRRGRHRRVYPSSLHRQQPDRGWICGSEGKGRAEPARLHRRKTRGQPEFHQPYEHLDDRAGGRYRADRAGQAAGRAGRRPTPRGALRHDAGRGRDRSLQSQSGRTARTYGLQGPFFDRSADFEWHPGLLFPEATIQVSYLKDLVTLVDPTSPYSFLAFLHDRKRLYRFLNRTQQRVSRKEFNQYLQWVAGRLPNVEFGAEVREVTLDDSRFAVRLDSRIIDTTNLVLGTGLTPNIPPWAQPSLGTEVFHSIDYLRQPLDVIGKVVAVVGGGQSGAEVVWHLLLDIAHLPAQLVWISHRPNFLPLDESPFTNELFNPVYSDYFFSLTPEQRDILLDEQKLASDGISQGLLQRIYDRLYDLEFLEPAGRRARLLPGYEVVGMQHTSAGCGVPL